VTEWTVPEDTALEETMTSDMIQIIVLAAIALFLVLRLRNVLGTRDGFENTDRKHVPADMAAPTGPQPDRVDSSADEDIPDDVRRGSPVYSALLEMKMAEPGFSVMRFLQGARGAYEMIIMGFERGNLDEVEEFLSPEVRQGFADAIAARAASGLTVEAEFIGVRDIRITDASFDPVERIAEITVTVTGELVSTVRNAEGEIVEGDPSRTRRQTDIFTFERRMGQSDPNWILVSTGG